MKSTKVYFAAIAVALSVAGCMAGNGVKDTVVANEDPSVLQTRAVERWNLLIAHQADKAWDYLTPGYRETKPRAAYAEEMNSRGVRWTKVAYGSQECETDSCQVRLTVDYDINMGGLAGMQKSTAFLTETWLRVKGRWYHLPEQFQPLKLSEPAAKKS